MSKPNYATPTPKFGDDPYQEVDEIIRDQISRVKVLESAFRHVHVSNGVNDLCKQCGLDLRDPIHERFG
jgi:hypothetical protein